jgi:large subunit ribosomal protein L24
MAKNKSKQRKDYSVIQKANFETVLRVGDPVMACAGGNANKGKPVKGQVGKILRFIPKKHRVVVDGIKMIKRHKRAMTSQDAAGIIEKEGSIHISNVMYYSEELKKPVRLKVNILEDGRKVRGYRDPKTKEFQQIDV